MTEEKTVMMSPGAAASAVSGKSLWKSKTLWVAALSAVAPFIPGVNAWVSANPQQFSVALGVIFGLLRLITKDRLVIK